MRQRPSQFLVSSFVAALALGSTMCAPPAGEGEEDGVVLGPNGEVLGPNGSIDGTGSTSGGKNGGLVSGGDGSVENPCEAEDAPEGCELTAPPACGDGEINLEPAEPCDDGNSVPGDGCSGACSIEPFFECPVAGQLCVSTIICGDGIVGPGEACDDANQVGEDGCAGDCSQVEKGYSCRLEGVPCVRVFTCGDGVASSNEGCDDGNGVDGDGCDTRCRMEIGFKCEGNPSVCTPTTCGDSIQEGAESCDDGNMLPFDGCSPTCRAEPICVPGAGCSSTCGDGITLKEEQCDDGNLRDGDGCSSACAVEDGFACTQPEGCEGEDCVLDLPIVYRDFSKAHADFGLDPDNLDDCSTITRGVARDMLSAASKPELSGTTNTAACISSTATFSDWYVDVPSNAEVVSSIALYPDGNGGYVNRYGENGEPYTTIIGQTAGYGASEAACGTTCTTRTRDGLQCDNECRPDHDSVRQAEQEMMQRTNELNQHTQQLEQAEAQATPDATAIATLEAQIAAVELEIADYEASIVTRTAAADQCDLDCATLFAERESLCQSTCAPCTDNPAQWCIGGEAIEFDGNPLFFPVEELMGSNADLDVALIPDEVYGGKWAEDPSGEMRNYFFTSEIAYWFEYTDGMTAALSFVGDDDMWVYVNGQLAVDLGGLHVPVEGSFTLNANGSIDQIHGTDGTPDENEPGSSSAAEFGLEPGNVYEVKVFQAERKMWGSSYKLTLSGFNAGASDCMTDCGDGEVGLGEVCDDGEANNLGGYNQCAADCTLGPHCGDSITQAEEACDYGQGMNDNTYGGCAANCQLGPHCGDQITSDGEQCDDGLNDGGYGECAPGCVLGPVCGDGGWEVEFEECDDGNNLDKDGCSGACKIEEIIFK